MCCSSFGCRAPCRVAVSLVGSLAFFLIFSRSAGRVLAADKRRTDWRRVTKGKAVAFYPSSSCATDIDDRQQNRMSSSQWGPDVRKPNGRDGRGWQTLPTATLVAPSDWFLVRISKSLVLCRPSVTGPTASQGARKEQRAQQQRDIKIMDAMTGRKCESEEKQQQQQLGCRAAPQGWKWNQ